MPTREYIIPDGYREIPTELTKPTIILTKNAGPEDDFSSASLYRGEDKIWTWAVVSHDKAGRRSWTPSSFTSATELGRRRIGGLARPVEADPVGDGYLRILSVSRHGPSMGAEYELETILAWWRTARSRVRQELVGLGEVFVRLELTGSHTFCNQTNDAFERPRGNGYHQLVLPGHAPMGMGRPVMLSIDTSYWGQRCPPELYARPGDTRDLPWVYGGRFCDWNLCDDARAATARFDFCGEGWIPCCASCARIPVDVAVGRRGKRTQLQRVS